MRQRWTGSTREHDQSIIGRGVQQTGRKPRRDAALVRVELLVWGFQYFRSCDNINEHTDEETVENITCNSLAKISLSSTSALQTRILVIAGLLAVRTKSYHASLIKCEGFTYLR
ncbi:hypothetical protein Y032_0136g1953 [Ancylostoma ceylanicum]|uniref:Uncharacterized protein n=1 Tax=Ancylostoma ceylanicum TaxID=53326 RepID=A0A016T539_9BILA|nr:hypothetical protein Y032_0136g1953 [Ancylostoma ceylanicum]